MRKPLYVEPDVALKNIPMFSVDEVEIRLNSILYRVNWSSGYSFKGEGKAEIEALRVFYVNNTNRTFRVKCIKGCESVFKIADGCATTKLYGRFSNAVRDVREKIDEDIKKCVDKSKRVRETLDKIKDEDARIGSLRADNIRQPKEVRI